MTSAHARPERRGTVGAPDLCRVTVLTQHTEVDLALPLGVPVALLLPGIVDLVASHRPENDFDSAPERLEPEAWTLARIGHAPLAGALSLDEHGIRDGELLVLEDAGAPAPPPLFDDVMYNVAVSGRDGLRRWGSGPAGLVAAFLAPAALTAGCIPLLALPPGAERFAAGAVSATLCVLLLVAAAIVSRGYADRRTALPLAICAVPLSFTSGMLVVPGQFAPPHLLLGTVATGAVAVIAVRMAMVGTATFTAITAVAAVASIGLVLASTDTADLHALGAGTVVVALLLIGAAPRLATVLARLPVPPVPAPGTSLDPTAPDPETPLPSFDELDVRATRARAYLTGLVYSVVVLAAGGAWCVAYPSSGNISWPGVALTVATAVVLMFRGRTYTAADKAAPLIVGGATIALGSIVGAAVLTPTLPWFVFGAALVFFTGTVVFGMVAPRREFTPVQRRVAELTEYAVIATIVPVACWVAGVYSAVRGL